MRSFGTTVAVACVLLPMAAMSATLTDSNIDTRTTTSVVSFSDLAFDNLDKQRSNVFQFHGAVGDTGQFTEAGPFTANGELSVVGGAGMSITNQTLNAASGAISYAATITGNTGLQVTESWDVQGGSTLTSGVSANGLRTLEFTGNNYGGVKAGGVFDLSYTLPGDWSTQGTATGDAQLVALNPEFTVVKDFLFDPVSDTTTIEVLNRSYDTSHPGVGLDFILFGSAVDEPGNAALLLGGLGALGWMTRCRGSRRPS